MVARLERDEHRGAARAIARVGERRHLRVRLAIPRVESLPDDDTVTNDDGADHRVRRRLPHPRSARASARRIHARSLARGGRHRRSSFEPLTAPAEAQAEREVAARRVRIGLPKLLNAAGTVPPLTCPYSPSSLKRNRFRYARRRNSSCASSDSFALVVCVPTDCRARSPSP